MTLDGVARVMVNGKPVASTVNSFIPYRFDITAVVVVGRNQIQVEFEPVLQYTRRQATQYPYAVPVTETFNTWTEPTRRSFVRKAGSDFGWDWGPAFVTSSITGVACLELQEPVIQLKDLHVVHTFPHKTKDLSSVNVTVSVSVEGGRVRHENVTFDVVVQALKMTTMTMTIPKNWTQNAVIHLMYDAAGLAMRNALILGNSTKTLTFTVADHQDVAQLTIAAFSQVLTLNWLQKSYANSITDAAVA